MLIASGGLLATGLQLRQLQTREKILNFWGQTAAAWSFEDLPTSLPTVLSCYAFV